jgi:hypothetical protein
MIRKSYSRLLRTVSSIVFLVGGALAVGALWWIFLILNMGAGMSDSAVSSGEIRAAPILWLVSLYFAVSGIGVLVTWQRTAMWTVAAISHLVLLVTFAKFCSQTIYAHYISGIALDAALFAVFFSPWILIWCVVLFRRNEPVA